jgi:hypothetical protein
MPDLPRRLFRDRHRVSRDHEAPRVPAPSVQVDGRFIVHVPVARFVELDTDHCLRGLEAIGIRVDRSKGSSAIDLARNIRASEAVREGFEALLFIDSDMMFNPEDAVRLLLRPEPVVAGIYAAKKLGNGQLNVHFPEGITKIKMGAWATEPYPVVNVGAGFLRIRTDFLRRMAAELKLPYCRMADRYGWPFFQPVVVQEGGETRYLCEDYAFCWRCRQMGVTPLVDTSFRLYHIGDYAYGWEEAAGEYIQRGRNLECPVSPAKPANQAEAEEPELAEACA